VRQEDTVARLGGDEFVIVLWELSHADGVNKPVSKVIQAVSQPYSIQGHSESITVSVGVSLYPTHGEDGETLMKSADLALMGLSEQARTIITWQACIHLLAKARN
jgi:diguanylate cyclase (GGDEF)-like protein